MSSLPSEAEARKILADKRSGQAVMDDYLKSQAEALGFIDTASEDDESRASSQNDAAPLVAAPTLVAEPAASAATVAEGPGDPQSAPHNVKSFFDASSLRSAVGGHDQSPAIPSVDVGMRRVRPPAAGWATTVPGTTVAGCVATSAMILRPARRRRS